MQARTEYLGAYLKLAASMGEDLDTRLWEQIAGALATVEYAERGSQGFGQLHRIARDAKDETEQRRYFSALMEVGDPTLAKLAAGIALSDEIPPQGARWRLSLVGRLADLHPELAWSTFSNNAAMLLAPNPKYAPLITAQSVPSRYWDCLPLDQLEAWVPAHVPAQMSASVARGMQTARFSLEEKQSLVPAADAYLGRN